MKRPALRLEWGSFSAASIRAASTSRLKLMVVISGCPAIEIAPGSTE
jgi:hypothetical protein